MAENLKESMPDDQKMIAELETVLQIENETKNKEEETVSSAETSLTKLQSDKNDSLSPVRLCPSLYSEVLRNYMLHDLRKGRLTVSRRQNRVDKIMKFGLIGKEAWISMISSFKSVDQLTLSKQVEFTFGLKFSGNYYSIICNGSDNLVKKLVTIAIPYVKLVEFKGKEKKWHNYFFEVLSNDSRQKDLEINGLKEVDDLAIMTLKKLVENGVLVKFGFNESNLWKNLPDCQFECLKFSDWHRHFLSTAQELKCSFNELRFVIGFKLFGTGQFKPYFSHVKRVFPNCQNLVFEIEIETDFFNFYVKECLDEMIEAVEDAPQSKVTMNVVIDSIGSRSDLPQGFICKNGHNSEWKCKSNENKIIKLKIDDFDSDYNSDDYYDSDDDYDSHNYYDYYDFDGYYDANF